VSTRIPRKKEVGRGCPVRSGSEVVGRGWERRLRRVGVVLPKGGGGDDYYVLRQAPKGPTNEDRDRGTLIGGTKSQPLGTTNKK